MILKRHIRPTLKRLNIGKRIGWHSFRHGLANLLRQNNVEIKTVQELLRHANRRITLDIYQQTVTTERRAAQALAVKSFLGDQSLSLHISHADSSRGESAGKNIAGKAVFSMS